MRIHFAFPWILLGLPAVAVYVLWAARVSYVNLKPGRLRLATLLRLMLMMVLLLALSQPSLVRLTSQAPVVILVDVSDSVPEARLDRARAYVRSAYAARTDQQLDVVTFAGRARRARLEGGVPVLVRHDGDASDLAQAFDFARGLSSTGAEQIVLLSDGNDTEGGAHRAVELARAHGTSLSFVRLEPATPIDARVTSIELPDALRRQEPSSLSVVIESTRSESATIRLEENGVLKEERQDVALKVGRQLVEFSLEPGVAGKVDYAATVVLPGDELPGNNHYVTSVHVAGPPRVLIVAATPGEGSHLEQALAAQEISVEATSPGSLPSTRDGLSSYDVVLLAGLAPSDLDRLRQNALASYVRDTGGGLLFVSGARGLRRDPDGRPSALASVLPVELASLSEREEPPVAIVLLIDRSGSMVGEKLSFAKQAARAVVDRLTAHDQVGILTFDANFEWALPLGPLDDKARVKAAVDALGAGGGTRFYPALEEAYFSLGATTAAVRHIILLTDGVSTDPDIFPELLKKARAASITVSTVAIGKEADAKLLGQIASLGNGRYSLATRADQVPNIFVKETETIQRDASRHSDTPVRVVSPARELAGIDPASYPSLGGYVRTTSKAGTESLLATTTGDPLLVRWRYGLGQVLVFTSDATPAWASAWLPWSGFGKLWSQLVRGAQRQLGRHDLTLTLSAHHDRVNVNVEAIDADGRFLNELSVRVNLLDAALGAHELSLPQVGPGRYALEVTTPPGSLRALPVATRSGRRFEGDWVSLARTYSSELRVVGDNPAFFASLVKAGARELPASTPAAALAAPAGGILQERPLFSLLGLIAVALFLLDLLVKRARWEMRS